jgi:hypothetical protein
MKIHIKTFEDVVQLFDLPGGAGRVTNGKAQPHSRIAILLDGTAGLRKEPIAGNFSILNG